MIFVCENNLYATATAIKDVTLNPEIWQRAKGYGIPGVAVDGNDVLAMWEASRVAIERARAGGGPTLIEAKTYRTVGHHEGDPITGTYRTQKEVDEWAERCPIKTFRRRIIEDYEICSTQNLKEIDERIDALVDRAIEFARKSPEPDGRTYALHVVADPLNPPEALAARPAAAASEMGWLDAVRDGIARRCAPTANHLFRRGHRRARRHLRPHQEPLDRVRSGADGRHADLRARLHRRFAGRFGHGRALHRGPDVRRLPVRGRRPDRPAGGEAALHVERPDAGADGIRVGSGAVRSAGPHHSGTYHPVWAHIPGMIVCMPSTPADAKGLMKTALRASDPVLMLEPKALFASRGPVPEGEHYVPFGVARIAREGRILPSSPPGSSCIARWKRRRRWRRKASRRR